MSKFVPGQRVRLIANDAKLQTIGIVGRRLRELRSHGDMLMFTRNLGDDECVLAPYPAATPDLCYVNESHIEPWSDGLLIDTRGYLACVTGEQE